MVAKPLYMGNFLPARDGKFRKIGIASDFEFNFCHDRTIGVGEGYLIDLSASYNVDLTRSS